MVTTMPCPWCLSSSESLASARNAGSGKSRPLENSSKSLLVTRVAATHLPNMRVKLAAPSFSGVRQADAADPVQSVRHLVSSPEQGARNDHTTPLVVRRRRACRHCDRHDLCTIHVLGWDGGRDRC